MAKNKSPWANNGGARPGSGRKTTGRKNTVSFCCDDKIVAWYREIEGSKSEILEAMIRRSKIFRDWMKGKKK